MFPVGEVLKELKSNFLIQEGSLHKEPKPTLSHDVCYLAEKGRYSLGFVSWATSNFGEGVVVEAMRRIHGRNKPAAYLAAVCRNVAREMP